MIKHLVMFYFTDKVTDENRDEIKRLIADSVKKIKDSDIKGVSELKAVFNIVDGMPEVGLYGEFEKLSKSSRTQKTYRADKGLMQRQNCF